MYIFEILLDALSKCLAISGIQLLFTLGAFLLGAVLAIPSFIVKKRPIELKKWAKIVIVASYSIITIVEIIVGVNVSFSIDISLPQAWVGAPVAVSFGMFIIPFFIVTLAYISNIFVLTTNAFSDDRTIGKVIGRIVAMIVGAMLVSGVIASLDCLTTSMNWNFLLVALVGLIGGAVLGFAIIDYPEKSSLIIMKVLSCIGCFAVCIGLIALLLVLNDGLMHWNDVICLFIAVALLIITVSVSRYVCAKCDGLKPKVVAYFRKKDANRVHSGRNTHQVNKITSKDEKFLENIVCPKCGSQNIGYELNSNDESVKSKRTVGQNVLISTAHAVGGIFGGLAAELAIDEKNREGIEYICLDCGHRYR